MIRVLAVVPSFFGATGDAVNERQLLIAISKKVEKCYVITFIGFEQILTKSFKLQHPHNLTIIPIPIPPAHPLIAYLARVCLSCFISISVVLLNTLGKMKMDLIYTRTSSLSIGFLTFRSLAEKTIVKIADISEEELMIGRVMKLLIRKLVSLLDRAALAKAKRVAVHNILFCNKLVRLRSFRNINKCIETPPGVDLDLIRKLRNQVNRELMLNSINIGFLGSLVWWQGADILVQAIALLRNHLPRIRLYFIGDGDSKLKYEIEKICKASNITYKITGYLPHEEALKYLRTLDIMVMPRRRTINTESIIPLKLIESWAMGVPVIATSHEVLKHKYRDGEDLLYVEPCPEDVASKILLLFSNRALREKLSKKGVFLANEFDYDAIANTILKSIR